MQSCQQMADGWGHKTFKGSREVDLNTRPAHPGRNSKFEWQSQFRAVRQPPKAQDARGSTASCFLLWAGSVHACFHLASIVGLFNPLIAPLATRKTPWSRGKTCPCCPREFAVLATFACQMLQAKSWQIQQSQQQHQLSASVFKAMNWSTSCKALAILRFHYLRPVLYKAFTNYVNFKEIKQFSPSF